MNYEDFKVNGLYVLIAKTAVHKTAANLQMLRYLFDEKLSLNCI